MSNKHVAQIYRALPSLWFLPLSYACSILNNNAKTSNENTISFRFSQEQHLTQMPCYKMTFINQSTIQQKGATFFNFKCEICMLCEYI